jgi:hypothetical protein
MRLLCKLVRVRTLALRHDAQTRVIIQALIATSRRSTDDDGILRLEENWDYVLYTPGTPYSQYTLLAVHLDDNVLPEPLLYI